MAHYIDADRLRAAVNNRLQENADKALVFGAAFAARTAEDNEIVNLIDSLQQEQLPGVEEHCVPGKDFIPVEWVDACEKYGKWKIVQQEQPDKDKKTFDDYLKASPSERRKMNMTEILGEEKLAETKKQMEQPEVDLEKELDQWRHEHFAGERDGHYSGEYLERNSQLDLARHFYELGLNARKEDKK